MPSGSQFLMAIDQGTSSSRCVIFDRRGQVEASAQEEFPQVYPQPGWVEHDPEAIWQSVRNVSTQVLQKVGVEKIAALGITNQRETILLWNRDSGECMHNAIVWQDRRTADYCQRLREEGRQDIVIRKTGLRLDPYFSATKIAWILDNVSGAREQAEKGRLACGTIECFLLWRLTGGSVHASDATNAARTLLFNIHTQDWDEELLELFGVPRSLLPDVTDCAADFGTTDPALFGRAIPICGMAGDQQAALIGQAGVRSGMIKSTYGTGCFVVANTGSEALRSKNNLLTTVAYRLDGQVTYALEGSIFVAGSAIQWLRDQLQVIRSAAECEAIAAAHGVVEHVHVVPAFAGLGAPYWDANARAAILGLSRDSGIPEIVTATLQAVAYQTRDLVDAMAEDGIAVNTIRVDGGMVANDWLLQFLADLLDIPVERPVSTESTVLGAAYLAGVQCGFFASLDEVADLWQRDAVFESAMPAEQRESLYRGWQNAVLRVRSGK
jgi:glycerol kinase